MGSPMFGALPGNNAPPPIPGTTNPSGSSFGGVGYGGSSFPNYPVFGSPNTGMTTPTSNLPLFGTGGMSGLSSGFDLGNNWQNFANSLGKAYGKGPGQSIYNILSEGLFNPQVAAAFLNAMQPGINQGQQSILNAFGAEGSRFGSAAGLGLSNFMSQANLNEQQTLASMYMQAQQEQLALLENILPTLHAEKANSGGWMHDLLGALEIGGGLAGAPFTGGSSLGLVGAGAQQLGQGIGGGSTPMMLPGMTMPGYGGNTGTFGQNAPSYGTFNPMDYPGVNMNQMYNMLDISAGADLGGAPMMIPGMNIS